MLRVFSTALSQSSSDFVYLRNDLLTLVTRVVVCDCRCAVRSGVARCFRGGEEFIKGLRETLFCAVHLFIGLKKVENICTKNR